MKKLKLEDLVVTSFETASDAARQRGTVLGAAKTDRGCPIDTYGGCADTEYFDCTLGCSRMTDCADGCIEM